MKRSKQQGSVMDSLQSAAATAVGTGNGNNRMVNTQVNGGATSTTSISAAATVVADDAKQNLSDVINSIEKTLGLLHQLSLTVSHFNVASQLPLLQRLNSLVSELDNMTKLSEKCNIQVPMEVLNLIDDGKNPDEFTRDVINNCIAENQITKGKTDGFKGLRKHLLDELELAFPNEVETYREIRSSSAAVSAHTLLLISLFLVDLGISCVVWIRENLSIVVCVVNIILIVFINPHLFMYHMQIEVSKDKSLRGIPFFLFFGVFS
ncbi:Mediator of RNA polymerase II transcription subunit 10b [Dionaea muscipula]